MGENKSDLKLHDGENKTSMQRSWWAVASVREDAVSAPFSRAALIGIRDIRYHSIKRNMAEGRFIRRGCVRFTGLKVGVCYGSWVVTRW